MSDEKSMEAVLRWLQSGDTDIIDDTERTPSHYSLLVYAVEELSDCPFREKESILKTALQHHDPNVKRRGVQLLGMMRDEKTFPMLVEKLNDPDVGDEAARVIELELIRGREIRERYVFEALLDKWYECKEEKTRDYILGALQQFNRMIVPELLAALKNTDENIRKEVVWIFDTQLDKRVVEALLPVLHDPNEQVRESVIAILRYSDDPRAIDALAQVIKDNHSFELKIMAIFSLARIGNEVCIELLGKIQKDEKVDPTLRAAVKRALGLEKVVKNARQD